MTSIRPDGPNILIKFFAEGEVLATAPFGRWDEARAAIERSVGIALQMDQSKLLTDLKLCGFSDEDAESICRSLLISEKVRL